MAKKKIEEVVIEEVIEVPQYTESQINKLDLIFPNEDMNKLRDKVNEIIDRLNN